LTAGEAKNVDNAVVLARLFNEASGQKAPSKKHGLFISRPLGLTYLVIDGICLLTYVHFADRLKRYLEDHEKVNLQNKIIGSLLVFSGIMLSLVNRE
jgi:threonine/homoserine/homoserine lactone efflux protein